MLATQLEEIKEALLAANVAPLVTKQIDPLLLEYVRRYSPLVHTIPTKEWASTDYYFNTRTQIGFGGFVTDGGARPVSNSTYIQSSFKMKLMQAVGAVTGYSQAVTRMIAGDLKAKEIEGSTRGLVWDIENAMCWGNAAATVNQAYPSFDGLDVLVNIFTGATQNAIDRGEAALALSDLDKLIDLVESNMAAPVWEGGWMIVCSNTAHSKIAQLLTNQQRFTTVEVSPGLIVPSYRNVALIKSSFLNARSNTMGTVTSATSASGGTLAAATYYYKVAAVMQRFGEIAAAAEVSQVTSGATSTATLSFTPPTGPDGATALHYKVYRATATGAETLIGFVDGVCDALGTATAKILDDGANLSAQNAGATITGTAVAYAANTGAKSRGTTDEDLYLIPRDEDLVVRPYVRDLTVIPIYPTKAAPDELPYAIATDTTFAVRAPKYVGRLARVNTAV